MHYTSLKDFVARAHLVLETRPVALIFAEDEVALEETVRHHLTLGFGRVVVFADPAVGPEIALPEEADRVDHDSAQTGAFAAAVNACTAAAPGLWFYYGYNAEFLFFPFCETRTVSDLTRFMAEERRFGMLVSVIDLYAMDLDAEKSGVDLGNCAFDRSGYYALDRHDQNGKRLDKQANMFGGLRWRFEEHVPEDRRRIDRYALFRAAPGLELGPDHLFNDPLYNTFSCPWHHSVTAAVGSFRAAKALKSNPASSFDIHSFTWERSEPFTWSSQQLMDCGLMEPGQWF